MKNFYACYQALTNTNIYRFTVLISCLHFFSRQNHLIVSLATLFIASFLSAHAYILPCHIHSGLGVPGSCMDQASAPKSRDLLVVDNVQNPALLCSIISQKTLPIPPAVADLLNLPGFKRPPGLDSDGNVLFNHFFFLSDNHNEATLYNCDNNSSQSFEEYLVTKVIQGPAKRTKELRQKKHTQMTECLKNGH